MARARALPRSVASRQQAAAASIARPVELEERAGRVRVGAVTGLYRVAAGVAAATVSIEAAIAYRLWAQFSASVPTSRPLSWLYGASGVLVDPLRGLDTATPIRGSATIEFPALIALEAYLLVGVALTGLLILTGRLLEGSRGLSWIFDLACWKSVLSRTVKAIPRAWSWADAFAYQAWLGLRGYLRSRDWEGLKSPLMEVYRTSEAAIASGYRGSMGAAKQVMGELRDRDWRADRERLYRSLQRGKDGARSAASHSSRRIHEVSVDLLCTSKTLVISAWEESLHRVRAWEARTRVWLRIARIGAAGVLRRARVEAHSLLLRLHGLGSSNRQEAAMTLAAPGRAKCLTRREFLRRLKQGQ